MQLEEPVHAKLLHPAAGCPVSELSIWVSESPIACIGHKILNVTFSALKLNQTVQTPHDLRFSQRYH